MAAGEELPLPILFLKIESNKTMKSIKSLLCGAALALAVIAPSFAASVDTSGIGINAPKGLDDPRYISRTWLQTNNWPAGPLTNGNQIILTNVVIAVEPDQGIFLSFTAGTQSGTAVQTNALVLYGDVSGDGGRTYTTLRPISQAFTITVSNAPYVPVFFIPYTNCAAAQLFRFTAISNIAAAGALNHQKFWLTNVVLGTRWPAQWGR